MPKVKGKRKKKSGKKRGTKKMTTGRGSLPGLGGKGGY